MIQERLVRLGPDFDQVALACLDWGDAAARRTVVCVHGLTRNAHDFAVLAEALADRGARVIAVDMVGRGHSSWLADPQGYRVEVYAAQMRRLIGLLGLGRIDWIGTSMGGLIGIFLASYPRTPIHKLLVNDVGPRIPAAGLKRIADYVGRVIAFDSIEQMSDALRVFAAPFGKLTDERWRHMIVHSARRLEDGRYAMAYDPGIADVFKTMELKDIDLWPVWDAIRCPTLVLRGVYSDVLDHADAIAMTERGPKAQLIEFPGMGHAPALMSDDQIAVVRDWLLAD